MQRYNGQLINQFANVINGNAAAGAQVTVKLKSTGATVTLYATDDIGGATLANPLTADAKGYYGFYAPDGIYTLDVNISGTPQLEIQLQDIAALQAQFDAALANAGYIPVGTFAAGCTVSQSNGVVSDGSSFWRWDGALPKTVTAGSEPTPTGVGNWVLVSDGAFRDALADNGSTELIAGFQARQLRLINGIKNLIPAAGVCMDVAGFYAGTNVGGGKFYYDPGLSKSSHNGGTIIAPEALAAWAGTQADLATLLNWTGTGSGCFVSLTPDVFEVAQFGWSQESPSTLAANKCISAWSAATSTSTVPGFPFKRSLMQLVFPRTKLILDGELNFDFDDMLYASVDFNGCTFVKHTSFTGTYAMRVRAWRTELSNFALSGFAVCGLLQNANLDNGRIKVKDFEILSCDKGFVVDARSTLTTFENYDIIGCPKVCEIITGDKVVWSKGWIAGGDLPANYSGMFELNSDFAPHLVIDDTFIVPRSQTYRNVAYVMIKKEGRVTIKGDCQFGGEPGMMPLVANLARQSASIGRGLHIDILDSEAFTSGDLAGQRFPMVELYALPNSVTIRNVKGYVDANQQQGLVGFNAAVRTFDAALADTYTLPQIDINGITPANYTGIGSALHIDMMRFIKTSKKTETKLFSGVSNASTQLLFDKYQAGRARTLRVSIINYDNAGADRYSEYILTCDSGLSATANWILQVVSEGATVSGRLLINGSGQVMLSSTVSTPYTYMETIDYITENNEY